MRLVRRLRERLVRWLMPVPVRVERALDSLILSAHDERAGPSDRLLDLAVAAIEVARRTRLEHLRERQRPPYYAEVWPGEHYRLLTGLARALSARRVVELGTGGGLSALALLAGMPPDGELVTFDLVPWPQQPVACLRDEDFADGRLRQVIADVSDPAVLRAHQPLFEAAELIIIDAEKDGHQEQRLLATLETFRFAGPPVLLLDDIRFWDMLAVWRGIERPKLDLTSFGHWSGTGLVDWC